MVDSFPWGPAHNITGITFQDKTPLEVILENLIASLVANNFVSLESFTPIGLEKKDKTFFLESCKMTPMPSGLDFPLATPSTLNLIKPRSGHFHLAFALYILRLSCNTEVQFLKIDDENVPWC